MEQLQALHVDQRANLTRNPRTSEANRYALSM